MVDVACGHGWMAKKYLHWNLFFNRFRVRWSAMLVVLRGHGPVRHDGK